MKRKDIKALHSKSSAELEKELNQKRKEELKLRNDASLGQLKNHRLLTQLRDDLARLSTVLRESKLKETKKS